MVLLDYLTKNKEVYRLWFEYLRENEPYKNFCEKVTRENFPFPNIKTRDKHDIRNFYSVWGDIYNVTWEIMFDKLQKNLTNCIQEREKIIPFYSDVNSIDTLIYEYNDYFLKINLRKPALDDFIAFYGTIKAVDNFPKPSRSLPQKEISSLWKNLEIWLAVKREGLTLDDAIKKVDPDGKIHKGQTASICRSWIMDIAYAEKIIDNAGRGLFPGPYKS